MVHLWRRVQFHEDSLLTPWPVRVPENWVNLVQASPDSEVDGIRHAIRRSLPYGASDWCADAETATELQMRAA